jgi:hypothetical protein
VDDDEPPVGVVVEDPPPDVGVVVVEPLPEVSDVAPAGIVDPENAHELPVHRHQLLSPPRT